MLEPLEAVPSRAAVLKVVLRARHPYMLILIRVVSHPGGKAPPPSTAMKDPAEPKFNQYFVLVLDDMPFAENQQGAEHYRTQVVEVHCPEVEGAVAAAIQEQEREAETMRPVNVVAIELVDGKPKIRFYDPGGFINAG